jgi:hypothetical protein
VEALDSHAFEVRRANARGADSPYPAIRRRRRADVLNRAIEHFCLVLLGNSAANG